MESKNTDNSEVEKLKEKINEQDKKIEDIMLVVTDLRMKNIELEKSFTETRKILEDVVNSQNMEKGKLRETIEKQKIEIDELRRENYEMVREADGKSNKEEEENDRVGEKERIITDSTQIPYGGMSDYLQQILFSYSEKKESERQPEPEKEILCMWEDFRSSDLNNLCPFFVTLTNRDVLIVSSDGKEVRKLPFNFDQTSDIFDINRVSHYQDEYKNFYIAVSKTDNRVEILNLKTLEKSIFEHHSRPVWDVKFHHKPSSNIIRMVTTGWDNIVNIWDVNDPSKRNSPIHTFTGFQDLCRCICFIEHEEEKFYVSSKDCNIRLMDLEKLEMISNFRCGSVSELEYMPELHLLCGAVKSSTDVSHVGDILLMDTRIRNEQKISGVLANPKAFRRNIQCVVGIGSHTLVSGGNNKSRNNDIFVWDLRKNQIQQIIPNEVELLENERSSAIRGISRMEKFSAAVGDDDDDDGDDSFFGCVTINGIVTVYGSQSLKKKWSTRISNGGRSNGLDFVCEREIDDCFGDWYVMDRIQYIVKNISFGGDMDGDCDDDDLFPKFKVRLVKNETILMIPYIFF